MEIRIVNDEPKIQNHANQAPYNTITLLTQSTPLPVSHIISVKIKYFITQLDHIVIE